MCSCVDFLFFVKQKTAYEMRISDWSSDVCSSDLRRRRVIAHDAKVAFAGHRAVYRVAAIKRQAVGGGLHVLPAEGHLGLAEAQAKILPLVEEDVRIDRKSTRLNSSH